MTVGTSGQVSGMMHMMGACLTADGNTSHRLMTVKGRE